ncbi:unnamed protein product [Malus baccata var. baccata]
MANAPDVSAAANKMPEVVLASSIGPRSMPAIGFGTAANKFEPHVLKTAVVETLGEAIQEALGLGLVASRDQVFVTSKLWITDAHPHLVIPALHKSLQNLQLKYLDLYLIHWPISAKPGTLVYPLNAGDLMPMDFKAVWAAMEECQRLGLTKSIGLSNFSTKKIENILSFATIPPSVNQVEMNPLWQQKKLRDFCKTNGIIVTAFSPLGGIGSCWGSNHVFESKVLQEIAKERGKTIAQVCIRWVYQAGATLAVKSYNKERLKQNVDIFDWKLSETDIEKISQIPQRKMMLREDMVSVNGPSPYKSLEDLWDGEL